MNLEQAAQYWKERLIAGKPINRVRVRRLLELAGAERRGWAIMKRIDQTLTLNELRTEPDFRAAWIDAQVSIRLADSSPEAADSYSEDVGETDIYGEAGPADPAVELVQPCDQETAPVAENLNITEEDAGVVEIPNTAPAGATNAATAVDAVRRVGSIASANRGVVSVNLQEPLSAATTRMMFEEYSQLAIMQGERNVRGIISWESIAKRSLLKPEPTLVSDCRVDAQVIEAEASLFDALPTIAKHGYVLVRGSGKITGIVTASDLAVELRSLSYAFVSIGTIEGLIRRKLHVHVTVQDLQLLEEHSKARTEIDATLMTFGENVRLLEREEVWNRLAVSVDKTQFIRRLLVVRDIRNDVMHFNPDPLGPNQKKELEQMEQFLRQVFW